jgi:hypothetical protein
MTIQGLASIVKNRNRFANFGNNTANRTASIDFTNPNTTRRDIETALNDNLTFQLKEAHNRIQQQQREQQRRRSPRRQTGSLRLSNTDSIGRARQVRARLLAKLQEVYGSDMEERSKGATAMDIQLQINRVDQQIMAIRRRERAIEEERLIRRKDDSPERRRRRARDMQEKRIYIRRDFLFHANKGGFDPNNPLFTTGTDNALSSVSFDIGGDVGTMDIAAPTAGMQVDFNMEVVL